MLLSRRLPVVARSAIAFFAAIASTFVAEARAAAPSTEAIDYATQVQPILRKVCFDCHGNGADEADLALDQIAARMDRDGDHPQWLAV